MANPIRIQSQDGILSAVDAQTGRTVGSISYEKSEFAGGEVSGYVIRLGPLARDTQLVKAVDRAFKAFKAALPNLPSTPHKVVNR